MSTIRVDKIRPFQSSSVTIEGGIIQANAATTGSNTFVGNQNIQGTITASIAEGFALVGGVGNVSTLVATSSFGGALTSGLVSGSSQLTASYDVRYALSGSSGTTITTGSFATTGSNTFKGNQILSGSVDISGSINSDGYELAASSTSTILALNSTFNLDLVPSGSTSTFINKSLVLGDGKILVAGRFRTIDGHTTNDIARLNSDGTVDTSFASPMFSGSSIFLGRDDSAWINTFTTQSDGKIVVGGNFIRVGEGGDARRGIARLNANGTLDTSFVTQSFDAFSTTYGVRDIVIQNDDKIVFVGDFTSGSRRVNTDGTIDTSFNINQGNNQPTAFNNGEFHSVALLDSGSEQAILIGGEFQAWGSFSNYHHLVKLHPSGALDSGFAGTNLDITTGNSLDRIKKIKVGDDGYIYVAGRFKDTLAGPNVRHAGFARLTTTDEGDGIGAFESGFRTYISGSDQNLSGVTVYVNDFDFYDGDKILLGGNFITFGIPTYSTTSANRFAIVSQNTGNLISGWAASGSASTYNLNTGSVNSVTLLPNNNVLVGGTFTSASSPQTAREGLASLKLTGFGNVTTTSDYSITADTTQLLISSSNTYFSGDITASTFSGSFVGDGSGLTGIPGVTPIQTGSFATTGSNTFKAEQTISSSLIVTDIIKGTGSIFLQPDLNDSRDFRIYNTAPSDIHIKGNAAYSFFGDDTNYLKIDDNTGITSIVGVNGVVVSGSLNASGSNTFVGNQTISGSVRVSGSISQKGVGGTGNIVIGENPLTNLTSEAIYNVIIGQDAGVLNSSGSSNVYIGRNAGILNQIGNSNVMIGTYAGYNAKNSQNVYIGESAGAQNISGQYNVAIGHQAGYNNKVNLNTFIGWQSGFANSSGSGNTFVGERSGESNTIGNNNSFFGGSSGRDTIVGSNNTFIGQNAGQQNTSGSFGTFVGSQAGSYTTTGNNNTFVGASAGILNTTGYSNAFFGDNSGLNNTTAYENTFVGSFSGYENRTGVRNTFVGVSAGQNTRIGQDNTYIGHRAGNSNVSGSNNTYVGLQAGFNITSGSDNTFLGKTAGYYISDGSSAVSGSNRSVFIGTNVKSNGHDQTNQIVIGYDAIGNGSNTVTLGNNDITDTYVRGVLRASTAILAQVSSSYNFADDTAAQAGGVPLGGLYHTSGSVKIRLV
jgi:uncharacterized delta-60 repeat protein